MAQEAIEALRRYAGDRKAFIEDFFTIVPREAGAGPVPMRLNRVQRHYWAHRVQRMIIAKARRVTISSIIEADFTSLAMLRPGTHVLQMLQKPITETQKPHLRHIDGFIRSTRAKFGGAWPVLTTDTQEHKTFDFGESEHGARLESSITIVGSGSRDVVQGGEFAFIHATELPSYEPDEMEALERGIMGSPFAAVRFESRPERAGDVFHQRYQAAREGRSSYRPVFYPWFWAEEHQWPRERPLWEGADTALAQDGFPLEEEEAAMMAREGLAWAQMRFWRAALYDVAGDRAMRASQYACDDTSCWSQAGSPVMPADVLYALQAAARQPLPASELSGWNLYGGALRVWRLPQPGRGYAIYADPAEGLATGHDTAVVCRRADDWAHCFTLVGKFGPEDTGRIMMELGRRYNMALLGWERDPRSAGIRAVVVGHYPGPLYRYDAGENPDHQLGVPVTAWTKEGLVLAMRDRMLAGDFQTDDRELIAQYLAVQSLGAGQYDTGVLDIAMADIGCLQTRSQAQRRTRVLPRAEPVLPGYLR